MNKKNISMIIGLFLNTIIFANENSVTLGSIDVVDDRLGVTEGSNSYTTNSMSTSTKLNLSIKETPQTVSVITTKEIEDKNIESYNDVLRNISGIGLYNLGITSFTTYSRGFYIDYYKVDGVPYYSDYGSNNFDLSIFDRVEVVKGANGLMTGEGNPSLSMNFVRKHANSKELAGNITLNAGSWDKYSQTTDITTPLTKDKKIRARVVVKNGKAKSFQDYYRTKNNIFYGIIDGEISDSTSFSIGGTYQELFRNGGLEWGLPAFYSDMTRTDFSRSTSFSNERYYSNYKTKEFFANVKHYINDDINVNLSASYKDINLDQFNLKLWGGTLNKADGSGITVDQYKGITERDELNLDAYIDIPFKLANLEQEILSGVSYNRYTKKMQFRSGRETPTNIYNYDGSTLLNGKSLIVRAPEKTEQIAAYLVGRFSLTNSLKFISGLRATTWKYHNDSSTTPDRKFDSVLTPYVGLIYNLNENHSLFVSYTDIFQTQNRKDSSENYLDPIVGENYEAGIKGSYFNGKLNTTLSVFRVLQDNVANRIDPAVTLSDGSYAYESRKGVLSKGFEFALEGAITDKLNATFSLTNFEAKDAEDEKVATRQARTTSSIFINYQANNNLNLGGGIKYNSKTYGGSGTSYVEQKAYTLANIMAKYKINNQASLQFNVNNLFDKKYYEGIGADTDMVFGEPRNFNLSLKYTF